MRHLAIPSLSALATFACAGLIVTTPAPSQAQRAGATRQSPAAADGNTVSIALPSGERDSSLLLLERDAPRQVRLGQGSRYTIRATNLTENALGQVVVTETLAPGVQIESSQPSARPMQGPQGQMNSRDSGSTQSQMNQGQMSVNSSGSTQSQGRMQQNQQSAQANRQGQQGQQAQVVQWDLGTLAPRETRTISVNAVASQLGTHASCLTASYFPAVCVATQVVQPNLELMMKLDLGTTGPVTICETPRVLYRVRNVGTGTAQDVQVIHPLPEGIQSADGQSTVVLPVGDLPAGESRDLAAELRLQQTGQFETRAHAKSADDEAYSSATTLQVVQPSLDMMVVGPDRVYFGEPVRYNVTVRNTGEVEVQNVNVALQTEGIDPEDRARSLGNIAPGQARALSVAVRDTGKGTIDLMARASALCAEDVMGSGSTTIRTIPALRLENIDRVDPVKVGENTVYAITIKNQGNGPANNVRLTGTLPSQFEFVEGSGASAVTAQGGQIQFEAIPTMAPGQVAAWYLTVKANQPGDVRFKLEMNSDYLDQPVTDEEPTRAY